MKIIWSKSPFVLVMVIVCTDLSFFMCLLRQVDYFSQEKLYQKKKYVYMIARGDKKYLYTADNLIGNEIQHQFCHRFIWRFQEVSN